MASFFQRLFKKREEKTAVASESFAARFHRFKLFLSAYIDAYSEMMSFEERLADELPIGMPFLRTCTAKLTISTMQCVLQLNTLGGGRFGRLNDPFSALRHNVQAILDKGVRPLQGPLVVPYEAVGEEHADIISSSLVKLSAVKDAHPDFMPRGFVVTGAAWWRYFNDPDMHDEIDRIILISQEDPSSYSEAAAAIRERITSSFPLPDDLIQAVRDILTEQCPELGQEGYSLLVRGIPVRPEHGALVIPEQVLHTPVEAESVLKAVQASLVMTYRPRAMLYRLKRGIRDRAMPINVSVTLMPRVHARGSAHRKLETLNPDELFVHVRRTFSTPESWPLQHAIEGASLPAQVQARVEECSRIALDSLTDGPVQGNRHEIFWVASTGGDFYVLGVNALPDPVVPGACLNSASFAPTDTTAGNGPYGPEECCPGLVLRGGLSTYPGLVQGRVKLVRNYTDALFFRIGDILVLPRSSPRWSFLLDFAAGAVVGDGTGNGLFARTARRYGRPTILRQPAAFEKLTDDRIIRMIASADHPPEICILPESSHDPLSHEQNDASAVSNSHSAERAAKENKENREASPAGRKIDSTGRCYEETRENAGVPGAAYPLDVADHAPPTWMPSGDLAVMARELAPKVVSLTLPDSDDTDFRAENCTTFHDFLAYCHVHAVREMFRSGTSSKAAQAPAKQLVCDVPKQFWLINLDDGFYGDIKGPIVKLEEVASLPMRSLWEGFTDKPWDGPPQLDAKGFLSVLFEATANPNLDPASQSSHYTEKNVFLIAKRFCSMRCRFGFHFLSMDCLLGERARERFVIFQFKGGAANLARRIRRVHFVAELLSQFNFAAEIVGDTLTARLEQGSEEEFLSALRVLGYIVMHTRQLDMIMGDEQALAARRLQMLEDMLALAARPPLLLP